MKTSKFFFTIGNKKYSYTIKPVNKKETHLRCEAAKISQNFPNEDISGLLLDLGNLVIADKEYMKKKNHIIRFRINSEDKNSIEKRAFKKGYSSISGYLRELALKQ